MKLVKLPPAIPRKGRPVVWSDKHSEAITRFLAHRMTPINISYLSVALTHFIRDNDLEDTLIKWWEKQK